MTWRLGRSANGGLDGSAVGGSAAGIAQPGEKIAGMSPLDVFQHNNRILYGKLKSRDPSPQDAERTTSSRGRQTASRGTNTDRDRQYAARSRPRRQSDIDRMQMPEPRSAGTVHGGGVTSRGKDFDEYSEYDFTERPARDDDDAESTLASAIARLDIPYGDEDAASIISQRHSYSTVGGRDRQLDRHASVMSDASRYSLAPPLQSTRPELGDGEGQTSVRDVIGESWTSRVNDGTGPRSPSHTSDTVRDRMQQLRGAAPPASRHTYSPQPQRQLPQRQLPQQQQQAYSSPPTMTASPKSKKSPSLLTRRPSTGKPKKRTSRDVDAIRNTALGTTRLSPGRHRTVSSPAPSQQHAHLPTYMQAEAKGDGMNRSPVPPQREIHTQSPPMQRRPSARQHLSHSYHAAGSQSSQYSSAAVAAVAGDSPPMPAMPIDARSRSSTNSPRRSATSTPSTFTSGSASASNLVGRPSHESSASGSASPSLRKTSNPPSGAPNAGGTTPAGTSAAAAAAAGSTSGGAMEELDFDTLSSRTDAQLSSSQHVRLGVLQHERNLLHQSTHHFRVAAERDADVSGCLFYGLALRHGWGCRENVDDAVRWLKRAVEAVLVLDDHTEFCYAPVTLAATQGSTAAAADAAADGSADKAKKSGMPASKSVVRFADAAKTTDTVGGEDGGNDEKKLSDAAVSAATYELAVSYRRGWGVRPDPVRAIWYLQAASRAGDVDAMLELADMYQRSDGLDSKSRKSTTLPPALAGKVGPAARNTEGKKIDYKREAARWLRLAESKGRREVGNSWIWKKAYD